MSMRWDYLFILGLMSILGLASILGGLVLLGYWLFRWFVRGPGWVPVGRVWTINMFPLKSGAATIVPWAVCDHLGLCHKKLRDRMFVVYDPEGKVVTARTSPRLLQIKVSPTISYTKVRFTTSSVERYLEIDLAKISKSTAVIGMKFPTTDTEILNTLDCGDAAAAWISSELERPGVRLGVWPQGFRRDIIKARPKEVGVFNISNNIAGAYSNLSSFLLVNSASVQDLVERLGPDSSVGVSNFRGNIVVHGAQPYAEDSWEKLKIRSASFRIVKPCVRCILVTINPQTLEKDPNMEPLRTLKTYRQLTDPEERNIEGDSPVMGCYMGLMKPGQISVGDVVYAKCAQSKKNIFNKFYQYFRSL